MSTADLPEIELDLSTRVINHSVRVRPGHYLLPDYWRKGALFIDGDDIVVDFQGAVLSACPNPETGLDQHEGYGILIRNHRRVTIRNAVVRGFRYNIFVHGGDEILIENCDFSYGRSHRIFGGGVPRDEWVVIRDVNDWRTYGAGIWLERVHNAVVRRCRACRAQNGIVLADSTHSRLTDNDCSFNSGWGLALFAACDNVVSWNRADFCNRPWAGGLGADASGMAVSGGSHRNLIVGNSLTHGGDGFFLTDASDGGMNTQLQRRFIEGASNDNVIAYNDGSWSPANAFEGTFSLRNIYYRNLASDSGYGFWLGFSSDSLVLENEIARNRAGGIAIEQGAGSRIVGNRLRGNRAVAVSLTANRDPALDAFPSRDLEIRDNIIRESATAYDLKGSTDCYIGGNEVEAAPISADLPAGKSPDEPSALVRFSASPIAQRLAEIVAQRPADLQMYRDGDGPQGWEWTELDAFAPHDFRGEPAVCREFDAGTLELFVFDPERTRIVAPPELGVMRDPADPRRVRLGLSQATNAPGELRDFEIEVACGDRRRVMRRRLSSAVWALRWYDWSPGPGRPASFADRTAWSALYAGAPVHATTSRDLGSGWIAERPAPSLSPHHWALSATTRVRLPAGEHRFAATFDDALRLLIDGREVYANWRRNRPELMDVTVPLDAGEHTLTVEYAYESRFAVLRWYWAQSAAGAS
jgi:parallel beta-helix repeat protein